MKNSSFLIDEFDSDCLEIEIIESPLLLKKKPLNYSKEKLNKIIDFLKNFHEIATLTDISLATKICKRTTSFILKSLIERKIVNNIHPYPRSSFFYLAERKDYFINRFNNRLKFIPVKLVSFYKTCPELSKHLKEEY